MCNNDGKDDDDGEDDDRTARPLDFINSIGNVGRHSSTPAESSRCEGQEQVRQRPRRREKAAASRPGHGPKAGGTERQSFTSEAIGHVPPCKSQRGSGMAKRKCGQVTGPQEQWYRTDTRRGAPYSDSNRKQGSSKPPTDSLRSSTAILSSRARVSYAINQSINQSVNQSHEHESYPTSHTRAQTCRVLHTAQPTAGHSEAQLPVTSLECRRQNNTGGIWQHYSRASQIPKWRVPRASVVWWPWTMFADLVRHAQAQANQPYRVFLAFVCRSYPNGTRNMAMCCERSHLTRA